MSDDATKAAVRECLIFTRWAIVDLAPSSLERVAAYLDALLNREPMKSGRGWENERQVLGCLITDLRTMVRDAGEPVGVQRDLRDARTKADERSALARAELAQQAYHDLITDAIVEDRRARDRHADDDRYADAIPPAGPAIDADPLPWA